VGVVREFSNDEIRLDLPDFYHDVEPQAKHCKIKDSYHEVF